MGESQRRYEDLKHNRRDDLSDIKQGDNAVSAYFAKRNGGTLVKILNERLLVCLIN